MDVGLQKWDETRSFVERRGREEERNLWGMLKDMVRRDKSKKNQRSM